MLEVLREYGAERQSEEEQQTVRRAHTAYFAAWVKAAQEHLFRPKMGECLAAQNADYDNIRVALLWCRSHDGALGLQMAAAVQRYWMMRGNGDT